MERGAATMNVSPDKLAEYLADGWKMVKTPEENKTVLINEPVVPIPDAPELENKLEADPEPVSVDEAVKRIGKSRKGK
jgi:hypothetical protein